ncbi:MAG: phytanoyl-CoA dioxygenase family protein [Candidatus Omnitrophica bacterium]|nr:phytanoyl-CoA dioxygenase family protein [Candidatus Omnitrophota bacterium]
MRAVPEAALQQHLKELRVYGYTRIEQFLDTAEVQRLKALVTRSYEATRQLQYAGRPNRDAADQVVYNLQNKDKYFIDILDDPFISRVLMTMLNDPYYRFLPSDVPNYILSYYNARSSGERLDLHIDSVIPAPGERTWAMQIAFVLDDQTPENGCTVVVPGSHLSGAYTDRSLQKLEPIRAQAGDLVMWDSRLWHGTTANASGRPRWALIATFVMWWVKQTMQITRSLPDAMYQTLTDRQKALLGFCAIPPVDETQRINTKCGYDALLPSVEDYHRCQTAPSAVED